jgi:protein-disulfide isomerase
MHCPSVVFWVLASLLLALAGCDRSAPHGAAAKEPIYDVPVDGLPSLGDEGALVTIVQFTDYECVYCGYAEPTLAQLRIKYGDDLRVVVAERPMPFHHRARPAALAALAADRQGHFDTLHARLFRGSLDDEAIRRAAEDDGLDMARFATDLGEPAVAALARAEQVGSDLGVPGTPAFFINGRMLVGPHPYETFAAIVEERMAVARRLVASGVHRQDVYRTTVGGGLHKVVEGC